MSGFDLSGFVEYRPIQGCSGYKVGEDGSVWTCRRRVYERGFGAGVRYEIGSTWTRMRAFRPGGLKYEWVKLRHDDGTARQHSVHSLVLEAFRGERPDGLVSRHLDDVPSNNWLFNLVWGTSQENADDRDRNGHTVNGGRHHCAKLTAELVVEIRRQREAGASYYELVDRFGITHTHVQNIVKRKSWKHV